MTTVFVYEDVTAAWAGGDEQSRPAQALLAEGRAMLDAVTADFRALTDVDVITISDADFHSLANRSDYTLVIAPECDGRLEHLAREAVNSGGRLLGPSPDAIRLTADKLALAKHWETHGIATPQTWSLGDEPDDLPLVIKPRDGAGSQGVHLLPSPPAAGGEGPGVRGVNASGPQGTRVFLPSPPAAGGEGRTTSPKYSFVASPPASRSSSAREQSYRSSPVLSFSLPTAASSTRAAGFRSHRNSPNAPSASRRPR